MALYVIGSLLIAPNPQSLERPQTELPIEAIRIKGGSGAYLSAWYAKHPKSKAEVLLFHGVRANRLSMLKRATFLYKAGYSVFLMDFQAHGESPGRFITFGYKEALDARAALAYLREKAPGQKVGVIGSSLGGAAVLLSNQPFEADAIILEAVYTDIEKAVENRLAVRLGSLGRYLSPLLTRQMEPRLGISLNELRPVLRISALKAPVMIIAGETDQRTTLGDSRLLYEKASKPKSFWVVKGAGHVDFHRFAGPTYEERVLGFFEQYLKI